MNIFRYLLPLTAFVVLTVGFLSGFSSAEDSSPVAPKGKSLLTHGDFSRESTETIAQDWGVNGTTSRVETETREGVTSVPFLRLTVDEPRTHVMVYRRLYLPKPLPAALTVRLKVRYENIKSGAQNWNDGRFIMNFKSAEDKAIPPSPHVPTFKGNSNSWQTVQYVTPVPSDAQYVEMMPYFLQAQSGTMDFAAIEIFAAAIADLPADKYGPDGKPKQPKRPEIPMIHSTTITPVHTRHLSPTLHVSGNIIVDNTNREVWLQGVCIDSLEWCSGGEKILTSVPYALDVWKANVIRLPVNEEFWFGRNKWQRDGGKGYRELVDKVVELCAQRKAYLVLDLHRFGQPTEEHRQFWLDAAVRYKNHPTVLYELFNEPHDITWPVWRDGEQKSDNSKGDSGSRIGMQALLNSVRSVGANNPVIVGGLDWGYDLTGIASGEYTLKDSSTGQGIIYSSHVYPWKRGWEKNFLTAARKHPIFIGETGNIRRWEDFSFIPQSARTEQVGVGSPWPTDMIAVIQKYRLNWTGFSFHPTCGPQLIEDWDYTPTDFWGVYVKQALEGKTLHSNRLR